MGESVSEAPDIAPGRLDAATLATRFTEAHPPLSPQQAVVEANRCLFCHDAPCIEACPTGIDVPAFIRKIASGNLQGSAETILRENILGGSCARICPTEVLCQQACVRTALEGKPVAIGALQRHATDWLMQRDIQPFTRAAPSGRRIAVVGAGPAGLACAHRLALHGHAVSIYEAKAKPGGLNEYGIAAYKLTDEFARREVDFVLGVGGIEIVYDQALGGTLSLAELRRAHDAVFLAIGQSGVRALGIEGEALEGVRPAVDFIAALRQAPDKAALPVGRRVVVIGGGNTAIDAATQARLLGAEEVSILYRRGRAAMSATAKEQDWAQTHGVRILDHAVVQRLHARDGAVVAVAGTLGAGSAARPFELAADMVLTAIGQIFVAGPLGDAEALTLADGRIAVDATGATSLPGVWAGGDCTVGADLTVVAVQDGKLAAGAIHAHFLHGDIPHG
jgi:glutamate synthase (NADPH/NADH) small chain